MFEDIQPDERVLDARPSRDTARFRYSMVALPEVQTLDIRSYSWRYVQTNQRREGACVLHCITMEAAARPRPFFGDPLYDPPDAEMLNQVASADYHETQLHDEYPETPPEEGTSLNAGLHTGMRKGYWGGYVWADTNDPEHAALQIMAAIRKGPVCFTSAWHPGMDRPDADGFGWPTGGIRGWHCYLLTKVNAPGDYVWTPNSWGGSGQIKLKREALVALLANQGEAAIPTTRRMPS